MTELLKDEIESLLLSLQDVIMQIFDKNNNELQQEKEILESKIENKIKKLKILKDSSHEHYQYKYNRIQCSFYKQTNQTQIADFYENELNDFEPNESFIYVSDEENDLDTSIEVVSTESTHSENLKQQDPFLNLISFLNEENWIRFELKTMLVSFNKFKTNLITNHNDFILMIEQFKLLNNEIENTINLHLSTEESNISQLLALVLNHLDDLKNKHTISFIIHTQNIDQPEIVLFENLNCNKQLIESRFRTLSLYFHPDKISLNEENKELATDFYHTIKQCRDKLINKFKTDADDIQILTTKGDDYFNEANKYRKECNRLKNLQQTDQHELKQNQELTSHFAILAYDQYKLACKLADQSGSETIEKQFELRKNMLLCFFISEKILEAQLIGVSLIFLIQKFKTQTNLKHKEQVRKLLDKINSSNLNRDEIAIDKSLIDFNDITELNDKISEQLRKGNILILSQIQNVRLDAPKTDLIKATSKKEWRILKLAYDVGLIVSLFSIPGTMISSFAGTLMGLYVIIDQRQKLVNKLSYLENINKIIQKALNEYKSSNYMKFLEQLCEPYNSSTDKPLNLFKMDENKIEINAKNLVSTLLEFNFPPDGIGYLLNLIANALVSGVKFKQLPFYRIQSIASDILDEISCAELELKAIQLDKDISSLRRLIGKAKLNFSQIRNYLLPNKKVPEVADELVDESSTKGSFVKRLGEIKLVAKINTAILSIINAGLAGIDSAKVYIEQVQSLINEQSSFQYNEETKMRLELLELLFWSFTGQEANTFKNMIPLSVLSSEQFDQLKIQDQYLSYLDSMLERTYNRKEKIELLNKKGNKIMEKADLINKDNLQESFLYYKLAYKAYLSSFKLENSKNIAGIQILKCLLNLKQYNQIVKFSNQLLDDSFYENNYQLWLYRGISYRCINNFKAALHCLDESNKKQATERAKNELSLVKRLNSLDEHSYKTVVFSTKQEERSSNKYRILSIDNGGINGILPAMILAEIENRAKKPIVEMFDLVAGSSISGAPLAAGLCMSDLNDSTKPQLHASDLFDFYKNNLRFIFQYRNYSFFSSSKYKKALNAFNIIEPNRLLSETCIDVLIAAEQNKTVKFFSSLRAKKNPIENIALLDVVWASSSVSTYFDSYAIENIGDFYQSDILTNNMAKLAYDQSILSQNIDSKNVFCLSLGTGCYIKDLLDLDINTNSQFVNEYKVDCYLKDLIGNRYQRCQVYLPELINSDSYEKINDLISYGQQFIEDNNDYINNIITDINKYF